VLEDPSDLRSGEGVRAAAAIVDIDLADLYCQSRRLNRWLPVLVVLGSADADVRTALATEADDGVSVAHSVEEAAARLERLAESGRAAAEVALRFGAIELFPQRRDVVVEGKPVDVAPAPFTILEQLIAAQGGWVGCMDLIQAIWEPSDVPAGDALGPHLTRLRKALGSAAGIEYDRHSQYRLCVPES